MPHTLTADFGAWLWVSPLIPGDLFRQSSSPLGRTQPGLGGLEGQDLEAEGVEGSQRLWMFRVWYCISSKEVH